MVHSLKRQRENISSSADQESATSREREREEAREVREVRDAVREVAWEAAWRQRDAARESAWEAAWRQRDDAREVAWEATWKIRDREREREIKTSWKNMDVTMKYAIRDAIEAAKQEDIRMAKKIKDAEAYQASIIGLGKAVVHLTAVMEAEAIEKKKKEDADEFNQKVRDYLIKAKLTLSIRPFGRNRSRGVNHIDGNIYCCDSRCRGCIEEFKEYQRAPWYAI
jgi:hypothetical protein